MEHISAIAQMVKAAEVYADDTAADRTRANEYNRGIMKDTPGDDGRSQMVSRDVRAHIKKALASISRTILAGDEIVEYSPVGQGDEEKARQASDYVNYVVAGETGLKGEIYDAIHDALLLRNGIIKWWWDESQTVSYSDHSGLTDDQMMVLASDPSVAVTEHQQEVAFVEGREVTLHSARLRRTEQEGKIRVAAVPRERFLIHPDATSIASSALTGEKMGLTRSDLVAMGYDKELIYGLPFAADEDDDNRREYGQDRDEAAKANELVDYYDLFVRYDMDDDGISELRHMCFAGGLGERNLLSDEECDSTQYADIAVMRQPHQWEGISIFDDVADIQRAKTVLIRQTLDNLYWQNNPQPIVQEGAIGDMEAVMNPDFGKPIPVRQGFSVRDAVWFNQVPFVAAQSFGMIEYLDQEAQDRTGITDASAGLPADALQNMTAKASAMIEQGGIAQMDFMVRTVADGLRDLFQGILGLIVRHQSVARTVRLRGEWVEFDPRHWDAGMDCSVNIGLGAGTRERDMAMMTHVMGVQEKLLAAFGPDNPFVTPDNLYNTISKLVESAGLRTTQLYFTKPDQNKVAQKLAAAGQKPDPAMAKIQGELQLKQAEQNLKSRDEAEKRKTQSAKEAAQMQADLRVNQARIEAETMQQQAELQARARLEETRLAFDQKRHNDQMALEWAKLNPTAQPQPPGAMNDA